MTASAAAPDGRRHPLRVPTVRLVRAGLVAAIVLLVGGGGALAVGDGIVGALDALEYAGRLVPLVATGVTAALIVGSAPVTFFRGYLALSMTLFVAAAVGGVPPGLTGVFAHLATLVPVFGFLPVAYFFPTGHAVPRGAGWWIAGWVAAGGFALAFPWDPFPAGPLVVLAVAMAVLLASCLGAQLWRYARVSGIQERQQTKWVVLALALQLARIAIVISLPQGAVRQESVATILAATGPVVFTALPAAIGFAMLRYRLFDVDLVIGRAAVYGAVSGFILLVYLVVVGAVGLAWPAGTPLVLPVAATAIAALGLAPVHRLARRRVNRWLYGARDDPATVLARLARDLGQTGDLEATLARLAQALAGSLRLAAVEAVAEDPLSAPVTARVGTPPAVDPVTISLAFEGRAVGVLRLWPRPGERLTPRESAMLEQVADAAGIAVHAALVGRSLERSRAAVVAAREHERRQLHRELHDGVGPTLASVAQRLDRARTLIPQAPERAATILAAAQEGVDRAMSEVRAVVAGLRPPALASLGPVEALRVSWGGIDRPLVEVTGDPGPLPPAVETALYRIAMEAIGNAVQHSGAGRCQVSVATYAGELRLEVADDGIGAGGLTGSGNGLATMAERAAELGGTVTLTEGHPGTLVVARIPLGAPA